MMPYRKDYVSPYAPEPFSGEGFIGHTAEGDRVYVSVRVTNEDTDREYETIEHETINGCTCVSITGHWYRKGSRRRDIDGGGQCIDTVASVVKPAPLTGITREDIARLVELWDRWHLNDLRAGCVHQTPVWRDNPRYGYREYDLDNTPPCPVTGYRFGHKWLVEQVPDSVIDELRAFVDKLDGEDGLKR